MILVLVMQKLSTLGVLMPHHVINSNTVNIYIYTYRLGENLVESSGTFNFKTPVCFVLSCLSCIFTATRRATCKLRKYDRCVSI